MSKNQSEIFDGTPVIWIVLTAFVTFIIWSYTFDLDQFVRAQSKVFSKSRVQIIQSVDGGILDALYVKEGDLVEKGQILAKINAKRFEASSNEIRARVNGLRAKIARLTAEIEGDDPVFDTELEKQSPLTVAIEKTLFKSRKSSLTNDVSALRDTLRLAKKEKEIVDKLSLTGDVDQMEVLSAEKAVIDAEAKLRSRINEYLEKASSELADARDELAQSSQVLNQRADLVENSDVVALIPGYVKNINITTLGAVLKAGEELMEIIPSDDQLLIEAKVAPKDIADLSIGQEATVRMDPFDSSIFGTFSGTVSFISGDTIVEDGSRPGQEQTFYIVHISLPVNPVTTSIGKSIELIPGMTGQVDIKTGNRSVLTYLVKPIVKTLDKSFGEK
jgi:membrane fusion protein, adhesin transport system